MSLFGIFKKKIIANCGHETKEKDAVTAFGESTITKIPIKDGKTEYCHRCLEKMAIKCAWCGGVIFIGAPITLYSPAKEDFKIPEHAVVYSKDPLKLVGCLRWKCADSGVDRVGFWLPPGTVMRVPSPLEVAMQSGGTVVVSDLGDPKEAVESLQKNQK